MQNKMKYLILTLLIAVNFSNCNDSSDIPVEELQSEQVKLEHISTLQLTDITDGYGARPEIIAHNDYFYIIYLGNITTQRSHKVRIYDKDFNLLDDKVLHSGSSTYGSPTDIRVTKDGDYLYVFYELSSESTGANLFGKKYSLDGEFTLVAEGFIASGPYFFDAEDGEETLNDPASVVVDGRVYLMTQIKDSGGTPPNPSIASTRYRLRELYPDLSEIIETRDIDLSASMGGWSFAGSLAYTNGNIYYIQASITSFTGIAPAGMELMMVEFDTNWDYDLDQDVFALTDTANTTEGMPLGVLFNDNLLFVSYRVGEVTEANEQNATSVGEMWLDVYNDEFNRIDSIRASSEGLFGEHATVAVVGDFAYVAYGGKSASETYENLYVATIKFR